MEATASMDEVLAILRAQHGDPFHVLGMHSVELNGKQALSVRAFLPEARQAWLIDLSRKETAFEMNQIVPERFYEIVFPKRRKFFPYRLQIADDWGNTMQLLDPYSYGPVMTDYDVHLMAEGTHYKNYEKLGAHVIDVNGVRGVHFAVWAPNARRVSVIGSFNNWDGRRHPMRQLGLSGIWELFVPGLNEGALYKFEIKSQFHDYLAVKTDPYGFYSEIRPKTASIVYDITKYQWNDDEWMGHREKRNALDAPIAIYEVHLGSWQRTGDEQHPYVSYRDLAQRLVEYTTRMGYTHIELLPIMEHPLDASWGYQTIGYYAATSRHGTPDDLMYFIDHCHQNGIGVILDWVPGHFPSDGHGLGTFDGTSLYEHADPRKGLQPDWGTLIFNYGRNEVKNFLLGSALFWLEKYHVDGLRVDAVASMLYLDYSRKHGEWSPNKFGGRENLEAIEFIKELNAVLHERHPGVLTIAEESTTWPMVSRPVYLGGLGFSLKWNMGWMHDILQYMSKDPVHRSFHHDKLTFSLMYAFSENFVLALSHDEVVHLKRSLVEKMPGDLWQKMANLRLLYAYMYGHPGKKLLFMGGDIGQWAEWSEKRSVDWNLLQYDHHQKFQTFVQDLNRLYASEPALHQVDFDWGGFEWIDCHDWERSIGSFIRRAKDPDDYLVCVYNFTPVPRIGYRVGVPEAGFYREVLNSDSSTYWGSNVGNLGGAEAEAVAWSGQPFSLNLALPPLGAIILKPERKRA
jgi:1,4-alpha-glucan branching enzyme